MRMFWQFFGVAMVWYLCLMNGCMFAWPSSTLKLFFSETNTTLNRAMTLTEMSLVSSLSSIGALIGTPIFGYAMHKIGRRYCVILAGIPYVISWSLIASCEYVEVVLTCMFMSGIGGGAFLVALVFISEMCQDSIRGVLTSGSVIFVGLGYLLSYVMGGYLSYYTNMYFQLNMSIVYIVLIAFIKESPIFLLQKGLEKETITNLSFYRGLQSDSMEILDEFNKMKRILEIDSAHVEDATPEELGPLGQSRPVSTSKPFSPFRFLMRSESSKRALLLALVMVTLVTFMGMVVVVAYAEFLYFETIPKMSSYMRNMIVLVVTTVTALVCACLTDIAGRKILLISSGLGTGVCTLLLGTQLQLSWGPPIMTAILIYLYCITFYIGASSVPYVLISEIFLPEVRSLCSMIAIEWGLVLNFVIFFIMTPLANAAGVGSVFYIFSATSFATAAFSYFMVPETKGLSVDIIQTLLVKKTRN